MVAELLVVDLSTGHMGAPSYIRVLFPYISFMILFFAVIMAERKERKVATSARIRWVFTLHLSEDREEAVHEFTDVQHILSENKEVKAVVMQLELTPSTQHPHIQGGLWLTKRKKFGGVKDIFTERYNEVHIEPSEGNPQQVYEYNTKLDTRMEGTEPWVHNWPMDHKGQGTRSDLKEAVDMIKAGKSLHEVSGRLCYRQT